MSREVREDKPREKGAHQEQFSSTKKSRINEFNARLRATEVDVKCKDVHFKLLIEETQIMTADMSLVYPMTRAWFEEKLKVIADQNIWSLIFLATYCGFLCMNYELCLFGVLLIL